MASTYVNDLRLEEIGSGEQSGTWGDTTNTNLELIAEGLSYGTEAITTNADTHTSTVADGATDPARSLYIEYTGTLDSACTITIAPNTLSRVHFIENGTSGSQNIIISQGSGANVTIPPGDTKAVYLNGAGSGAAVVDAFASLSVVDLKVQDDLTVTDDASVGGDLLVSGEVQTANIGFTDGDNAMVIADGGAVTFPIASVFTSGFQSNGAINVGVDDTGYDVKFFGDTASAFMLWDASADDLILGGAAGLSVNSAALVTGVLTTTAATVFNGGFASNAISTIKTASSGVQPLLTLLQTDNTSGNTWGIDFKRTTGSASEDLVAKIHANREGGDATGMTFSINKSNGSFIEAARFDSAGNYLVGKTANDIDTVGHRLGAEGSYAAHSRASNPALYVNRNTSDGVILGLTNSGSSVGNIGSTGDYLFLGSDAGSDSYVLMGNSIFAPATSTGAARDGGIDLGYGADRRWKDLYLSGGVYLGGTGAGNLLNDYEEGGFTVGYSGATIDGGGNTAQYTKVGSMVFWSFYSAASNINSASGNAAITGLPFTVRNNDAAYSPVNIAHNTYFGGSTTIGTMGYHSKNSTSMVFNTPGVTATATYVNGNSKYLMISGTYFTDQ